jgi:hypothetical protein
LAVFSCFVFTIGVGVCPATLSALFIYGAANHECGTYHFGKQTVSV